jgi:hypothetical protein
MSATTCGTKLIVIKTPSGLVEFVESLHLFNYALDIHWALTLEYNTSKMSLNVKIFHLVES